jgi:hypothetical protein
VTGYSAPSYTAPSTGQAVRAVLFDTFGTVVDWRSGISAAVRAFAADHALPLDPDAFADAWRAHYEPAKERVRSGQRPYVSLDTLHRENLDTVLRSHGIDPGAFGPGELTSLNAAWHYSDLAGARRAGLATAFVARPAEYGPGQGTDLTAADDWDLTATSITELARQLLS